MNVDNIGIRLSLSTFSLKDTGSYFLQKLTTIKHYMFIYHPSNLI